MALPESGDNPRSHGIDALIEIEHIDDVAPWWPYSQASTYRLIRQGRLDHVAVGRRVFITLGMLNSFIEAHTRRATSPEEEALARRRAEMCAEVDASGVSRIPPPLERGDDR